MERKTNVYISNLDENIIKKIMVIQEKNEILISKTSLNEYLNESSSLILLAICNNDLVGFLIAKNLIDFLDLDYILVDKNMRRNNIATLLLNKMNTYCIENNINKILLEVRKSNIAALNLYLKNGFRKINLRKNYYSSPKEDAIILEKIIKI